MINVGSVGQPRDGDRRACYVVLDDEARSRYRRVEYDIDKTITEDLRHPGSRQLPGRPPARGTVGHINRFVANPYPESIVMKSWGGTLSICRRSNSFRSRTTSTFS